MFPDFPPRTSKSDNNISWPLGMITTPNSQEQATVLRFAHQRRHQMIALHCFIVFSISKI
jgi:hypothetical protein